MTERHPSASIGRITGTGLLLGLIAVLLLFIGSGAISYLNTRTLRRDATLIADTHEVLATLDEIASLVKDAETGQRGYVITGEEHYLEPYTAAIGRIDERLDRFEELTQRNPEQRRRVVELREQVGTKLRELERVIELRRLEGFDAARELVQQERGRIAMEAIRNQVEEMQSEERSLRVRRIAEMDSAYRVAVFSGVLTGVLGALLSGAVAYLLRQSMLNRLRQEWLQSGQITLNQVMSGDQSLEQLSGNVLRFLAEYLDAHAGAFFVEDAASFRRVATYGVPASGGTPERFVPNDGLLAQAVKDRRTFVVRNVPEGYLSFGSALGRGVPRQLAIVPVTQDGSVNGVFELGFVHPLNEWATELFERVPESIGVAIRSVNYRLHLQNLLEETQRQAEELEAQGEELRVSNEELEEQGRALRESQGRLENQQAELEQTNAQLEEQTQLLESQRDDLNRAKEALEIQASALERASQYKSDFLANMSHELRTPLNSSLILAKLLADNPHGNLTPEQVQFAETIQTSGNDLLTLINDILDLSKIEAGHMEVQPEPVRLAPFIDDVSRPFRLIAEQRGLEFQTRVAPDCPETIVTDRLRLEQVLKNLLSNAMKFTEEGSVELVVGRTAGGQIALAVEDTGIGIPADQRQLIFEAFRQADVTAGGKHGGTGLGLSISRELTRLLGGSLDLVSEPNQGSTFTITIPEVYDVTLVRPRSPLQPVERSIRGDVPTATTAVGLSSAPPVAPPAGEAISFGRRHVEDDRERLTGDRRVILAVEDDEPFARILYDLAHELGFQCLIAMTAEEGVAVAVQYRPSAVILDVGLPDHSGLWVLDRLKHDQRTRHVPVHVVSVSDYTETALSLGAVAYMLKPVKRDELIESLKRLETRLAQRMRRVLVVEDDPIQLDSMRKLIGSQDVETVGAGTAAECLERLKEATFDCMVLDLSLPDATGYALLETLSREDAYSFPPVIVYTGRELSADDEQRLRRYSKSIIIKGAKSPERLLDEVTLFLHQVESELPPEQQRMLEKARSRDAAIEGRCVLVVEDDARNVFALTSMLERRGAVVKIARNGREALDALETSQNDPQQAIDLVLMDVMMPEMDGLTAVREIRRNPQWKHLPVIMLTAKAMIDDQQRCLAAGANDYMAKPLDVDKLLSLIRVWMPK